MDAKGIRASDAERDEVIARLGQACGEGRLTVDELSLRIEEVCAAREQGQLEQVLADLPAPAGVQRVWAVADELLAEAARQGLSRGQLAAILLARG
ncbi:DUF1707 domain-containing protein [Saccharothrix sp. AJ9571]|nr:DUF1707 domain-containing protein [Saccharothrix sp. AJ9571]